VRSKCRTIRVASPTASIAGASAVSEPVISATINITASGARQIDPKVAIIPTMTKGAGLCGTAGAIGSSTRQTAAPVNAPITMPGPKMPPEPPEPPDPMDSEVARIFAKGNARTTHMGVPSSGWPNAFCTQPYPVPSTPGSATASEPTRTPPIAGRTSRGTGIRSKTPTRP